MNKSLDLLKVSLLIGAISGLIFNPNQLTILLLISSVFLNFKSQIKFRYLLLLSSIFTLFFFFSNQRLLNQMPDSSNSQEIALIVYPDDISIDGDNLKLIGTAKINNQSQKLISYLRIDDQRTKEQLIKNNKTLQFLIRGQLEKIDLPTNQFQFNQREYNFRKGICAKIGQATLIKIDSLPKLNSKQKLVGSIRTIRVKLINFFQQLPKDLSEYAQTLIVGYVPESFYDENNGLVDLGLIHLFTISGFHVSYLIKTIFNFFRKFLSAKTISALTTFILLVFYFLSGNNQVLLRAIIAGEITLFANIFSKKFDDYFTWSVSLLINLVLAPQILLTTGGQLSYLLTFVMLWTAKLSQLQSNLLLSLVTLPIIVKMRFSWHLLSIPINFITIPFFGTIILPVVLIGIFFYWFSPIANLCSQLIRVFNIVINWVADLPGQIIFGDINSLIIFPLIILIILAFINRDKLQKIAVKLLCGIVIIQYSFNNVLTKGELTIFDIGQGDSILIKQPNNRDVTLIDTGGQLKFNNANWQRQKSTSKKGEMIIVNYLQAKGISKIDQLVLTHQDQDHIGFADQILNSIKVDKLLIPDGMQKTAAFQQKILPYLKNTKVIQVTTDTQTNLPFTILYPIKSGQAENQDSIAIATKIGQLNFFSAGDLDQAGEIAIDNRYPNLKFDIVKLGHHGSKTSSNYQVLKDFKVRYTIISAGRNNRYGHPHPETIQTLERLETTNFNTQTNGMIKFEFNNRQNFGVTRYFDNYPNENKLKTITR